MITAVAILNWNGINHLKLFLPSVIENSNDEKVKIILIDNGSTDESCEYVSSTFPMVQIIKNSKNLGFAGGYNEGLKQVKADRFVLLNSDVMVTKGWIDIVNSTMAKFSFDICSPRILDYSSPTHFEYAGAAGGYIDPYGYTFCAGRIFNNSESESGKYLDDSEVFWASGAALFINSQTWEDVGGFDQSFFAHMEEVDLCWRVKNRGYKVGVCNSSSVYHLGGGTLAKSSSKKVYLNFRNNLLLILKNKDGFWPGFVVKRLILDGIAAFRFITMLQLTCAFAILKAHLIFYVMLPSYIKKRRIENKAKNLRKPNLTGLYKSSIIIDYFLKGKTNFSDLNKKRFL
tara:strand:+ start:417 stop:1448 length:1032 start_codon:yes stop_codon:yes gene_type:complete